MHQCINRCPFRYVLYYYVFVSLLAFLSVAADATMNMNRTQKTEHSKHLGSEYCESISESSCQTFKKQLENNTTRSLNMPSDI